MIPRVLLGAFLAVLMAVVGTSTYLFLSGRQSRVAAAPLKPTSAQPTPHQFILPGTLYLEQSGALYSLSSGRFHALTGESGWMQPSLMPNGNLLIVRHSPFYSDIFTMSRFGLPLKQLTNDQAPRHNPDIAANHWAFYPTMSQDGKSIFFSYDNPKFGYEVDLSVWSIPSNAGIGQGTNWSDIYADPGYTGGDIQPIPVRGGVVYTRYDRMPDGSIVGQLWYTNRPGSYGKALTTQGEDCREPSLSPDGRYLAMICTYTKQVSDLVIATYSNGNLGPRQVVLTTQMVAQPVWAPDGSGIAYLAPAVPDGPFQLWYLPRAAYFPPVPSPVPSPSALASATPKVSPSPSPSPSPLVSPSPPPVIKPIQITSLLGLDASSPMAWSA